MGTPSACDECGKKFKVFGIKKKCKDCMDVVCKSCLASHLELKHAPSNRSRRSIMSREFVDTDSHSDRDLEFMSPVGTSELELEYADLKLSADGIDASDEEEDDFAEHEEDEVFITTLSRHSSLEEEKLKSRELYKIQAAVATWASKEKQAKLDLRRFKRERYCCMNPAATDVGDYENCDVFAICYVVITTVVVWILWGTLVTLYMHIRRHSLLDRFVHML